MTMHDMLNNSFRYAINTYKTHLLYEIPIKPIHTEVNTNILTHYNTINTITPSASLTRQPLEPSPCRGEQCIYITIIDTIIPHIHHILTTSTSNNAYI
jgi:hypothetical protein